MQAGAQPWKNAFDHLSRGGNSLSQSNYKASPVKLLARLDQNNWAGKYPNDWNNYTKLMKDAAAAYQLALRWKLSETDGAQYADAAVAILNDWAKTCTGFIVNDKGEFIDPNEFLIFIQVHQIANAAEIMRSYSGWQEADFIKFKAWIADVFYPHITKFLSTHNGNECALHYWLNWDLSAMTALLSIGILADDNFKINEAIQYFKFGIGSGNIGNGVPFIHLDPDSNEMLGQCQESGRDQGTCYLVCQSAGCFLSDGKECR